MLLDDVARFLSDIDCNSLNFQQSVMPTVAFDLLIFIRCMYSRHSHRVPLTRLVGIYFLVLDLVAQIVAQARSNWICCMHFPQRFNPLRRKRLSTLGIPFPLPHNSAFNSANSCLNARLATACEIYLLMPADEDPPLLGS
jgi:hypothetical protein